MRIWVQHAKAAFSLAQAESDVVEVCCSKKYEALKNEPCDLDHFCNYVDWEAYAEVQRGGIVAAIMLTVVSAILVVCRDVLKIWTPTNKVVPAPQRQLTTMSAAYAGATMPEVSQSD